MFHLAAFVVVLLWLVILVNSGANLANLSFGRKQDVHTILGTVFLCHATANGRTGFFPLSSFLAT